jgi:hypothetical protein
MEKEGIMIPNNENFHGFKQFLAISKEIANKQIPYYLNWVLKFLQSNFHSGESLSIQEKVNLFADELRKKSNTAEWQVDQSKKAIFLFYDYINSEKKQTSAQTV